jgi:hypothetical protein
MTFVAANVRSKVGICGRGNEKNQHYGEGENITD